MTGPPLSASETTVASHTAGGWAWIATDRRLLRQQAGDEDWQGLPYERIEGVSLERRDPDRWLLLAGLGIIVTSPLLLFLPLPIGLWFLHRWLRSGGFHFDLEVAPVAGRTTTDWRIDGGDRVDEAAAFVEHVVERSGNAEADAL